MFPPKVSRDLARVLEQLHDEDLRWATGVVELADPSRIIDLPDEVQVALAALQGDDGLIAPTTEDTP